jgi:prepilin-type N-terminal cleavage/methylation domain-containing protein
VTPKTSPMEFNYAPYDSRRTRAFTLIELVIVIAIISITAVIAIPRLSGAGTRYRVDAAVQQILSDINITAAQANRTSQTLTIRFDADADTYTLIGQPSRNNPANDQVVDFSREPYKANMLGVSFGGDSQLDISGYGLMLESGQITLSAGRVGRRVVFTQGSSSVQIVDLSLVEPTKDESISIESSGTIRKVDVKGDSGSFVRSTL